MVDSDVAGLQAALAAKTKDYDDLQEAFDSYQSSSASIEAEYENELGKAQEQTSGLQRQVLYTRDQIADLQTKLSQRNSETERLTMEIVTLKKTLTAVEVDKRQLEISQDALEGHLRALQASEESLRCNVDMATEQQIMVQHELDDLKRASVEVETRLRQDVADLQSNAEVLLAAQAKSKTTMDIGAPPAEIQAPSDMEANCTGLQVILEAQKHSLAAMHNYLRPLLEVSTAARIPGQGNQEGHGDNINVQPHVLERVEELRGRIAEQVTQLAGQLEVKRHREEGAREDMSALQARTELAQGGSRRGELGKIKEEEVEEEVEGVNWPQRLAVCERERDTAQAELAEIRRQAPAPPLPSSDVMAPLFKTMQEQLAQAQRECMEAREAASRRVEEWKKVLLLNELEMRGVRETVRELQEVSAQQQAERDEAVERAQSMEKELATFARQIRGDTKLLAKQESKVQELLQDIEVLEREKTLRGQSQRDDLTASQRDLFVARVQTLEIALSETRRKSLELSTAVSAPNLERSLSRSLSVSDSMLSPRRARRGSNKASFDGQAQQQQQQEAEGVADVNRLLEFAQARRDLDALAEDLRLMTIKYHQQRAFNSRLLTRMQTMQNKIQVCCRIRPVHEHEVDSGSSRLVIETLSEVEVGFEDRRIGHAGWKAFAFDRVWGPEQTQEDVFLDVEALALSVLEGNNACIMAYGQTGSGKTYTMGGSALSEQGAPEDRGISHRILHKLLELTRFREPAYISTQTGQSTMGISSLALVHDPAQSDQSFVYRVSLSMVEVYNDELNDLLASQTSMGATPAAKATLDIRRDMEGTLILPGIVEEDFVSVEQAMQVIERGNQARATAATGIHEHSSRSHSILIVTVTSRTTDKSARLYLVDLAGSERVKKSAVTGPELKEAQHINKSLSALGDVMEALDRKASHVPYRNSKLTHLLQDCLGGMARTLMIVTVCPLDDDCDETLCTLQFATRVRNITLNMEMASGAKLKNLEMAYKTLRSQNRGLVRKGAALEGAMVDMKRDYGMLQKKVGQVIETKKATEGDLRRQMDEQNCRLRMTNLDLQSKLKTERDERYKVGVELQDLQRELKKLQAVVQQRSSALTDVKTSLSLREREVLELRKERRPSQTSLPTNATTALQSTIPVATRPTQLDSAMESVFRPILRPDGSQHERPAAETEAAERRTSEKDPSQPSAKEVKGAKEVSIAVLRPQAESLQALQSARLEGRMTGASVARPGTDPASPKSRSFSRLLRSGNTPTPIDRAVGTTATRSPRAVQSPSRAPSNFAAPTASATRRQHTPVSSHMEQPTIRTLLKPGTKKIDPAGAGEALKRGGYSARALKLTRRTPASDPRPPVSAASEGDRRWKN